MKIQEVITQEAISFTTQRDYILNSLERLITSLLKRLPEQVNKEHPNGISWPDLREYIGTKFRASLENEISRDLVRWANDAPGIEPGKKLPYSVSVAFRQLKNRGHATYSDIRLTDTYIDSIMDRIWDMLNDSIMDNDLGSTNSEDQYIVNTARWVQFVKKYPYTLDEYRIPNILKEMISVFIHELVHIRQHSTQADPDRTGKNTEYRSYTIKNKQKFYAAINRIHNGVSTEIDNLSHASSPQEIPARAHTVAVDYINLMIDRNPLNMKSTERDMADLEMYIQSLDPRYIIDSTYKQFNRPGTLEYKIYRRFMKIVAQELNAYREHLSKHLEKLKQNYKTSRSW